MFDSKPKFCYCYFCGGPLRDAYKTWKYRWLPKIWPTVSEEVRVLRNCTGLFPKAEAQSIDELVCITEEDGRYWEDGTVISRLWKDTDFVCPTRVKFPYDGYKDPGPVVLGGKEWISARKAEPFLTIHRMCLSYMCRRLETTPAKLCNAIFPEPSRAMDVEAYRLIQYDDYMDDRYNGYSFDYARLYEWHDENRDYHHSFWTYSMKECTWLLAHPSVFPKLELASPSQMHFHSQPSQTQPSALFRVLSISELFSHIISFLRQHPPHHPPKHAFHVHNLLRTCQGLHNLLGDQQGIHFGLVRESGWMLPTTPADWAGWKAIGNPTPIQVGQLDWRAYLETFSWYEETGTTHNRWRLERWLHSLAADAPRV
ncbi:hypothetical protein BC834DRAFT_966720 [Gloeopeniophorella convolvens]|nr:hypothetical protein BC834DRAFT_966720 [Gloeopeniophorella convolvens]